jgi:outer membrane protein TolC
LDSNIRNLKQLLFETEEMQKAGFAEILDIDRLKLSIKQLSSQQGSLARQKQMAVNNLKFLMGFPIAQELQLTESLQNLALNGFATEVNEKLLLDNRAEYNALQSTIALNELNVKAQKQMAYYPSLAGFATYQQGLQTNKFDGNGSWFPTALIGLQLNVPIFDGFAREAKIERAKLDMEELVRSRDQLVESIHLEVENARIKYVSAVEQVTNAQESLEMAKRIYQTATIKYKGGVGSSLEINQAEGGLFAEQGKYIQALFGLLMAKAELEIALGK